MKLTIPTPCSENWDAMTPTACGRFCAVCQKEVIDVTEMDDDTILQKYTDNGGNLCIRAREEQLTPIIPVQTFPLQRLAMFSLTVWLVFAGGLVSEVQAQIEPLPTKKIEIPDELVYSTLTVRVLDENNQPVDSAEVRVWGSEAGLLTNAEGYVYFDRIKAQEHYIVAVKNKDHIGAETVNIALEKSHYLEIKLIKPQPIKPFPNMRATYVGGARGVIIEEPITNYFPSLSGVFDNNGNVILEQYKVR